MLSPPSNARKSTVEEIHFFICEVDLTYASNLGGSAVGLSPKQDRSQSITMFIDMRSQRTGALQRKKTIFI
jgi:hypothetical protein